MSLTIPVAHDFLCPWCWLMVSQNRRLKMEFDVQFDYLGYELWPEELAWPEPSPAVPHEGPIKPAAPNRFALALAAEGIPQSTVPKPKRMRTHNAHEAVEHAKTVGCGEELLFRLYEAYWIRGAEINSVPVILECAKGLIPDLAELEKAIEEKRYAPNIVGFDDPAYAKGVYNVPTYWIGGTPVAEQPYNFLRDAIEREVASIRAPYSRLSFPAAPEDRPYTLINMVTTIDGKITTGERDEPVQDLGSAMDHQMMRVIEGAVDAVLIGAGSLRATPGLWYPSPLKRYVVTESGQVDFGSRFFTDHPELAYVVTLEGTPVPAVINALRFGKDAIDVDALLAHIRSEGVAKLLIEGGSEMNASFLHLGIVDELFLTLAPKVRLGRDIPTYAGGEPLSRTDVQNYELLSCTPVGSEVFLRYRRK